jgi:hypothetical protein
MAVRGQCVRTSQTQTQGARTCRRAGALTDPLGRRVAGRAGRAHAVGARDGGAAAGAAAQRVGRHPAAALRRQRPVRRRAGHDPIPGRLDRRGRRGGARGRAPRPVAARRRDARGRAPRTPPGRQHARTPRPRLLQPRGAAGRPVGPRRRGRRARRAAGPCVAPARRTLRRFAARRAQPRRRSWCAVSLRSLGSGVQPCTLAMHSCLWGPHAGHSSMHKGATCVCTPRGLVSGDRLAVDARRVHKRASSSTPHKRGTPVPCVCAVAEKLAEAWLRGCTGEGVPLGQPGRAEPPTRVLRSRSVAVPAAAATSSMLTESHGTGAPAARRTLFVHCIQG